MKQKKRLIRAGIFAAVIVALAGAVMIVTARGRRGRELEKQLSLGERYLEELDYEKAIAAFEEAIEISPRNLTANLGLARAYEGQGNYDHAEAAYMKTLQIDETCEEAYDELSELYLRQDKLTEAKELLSEAVSRIESELLQKKYSMTAPAPPRYSVEPGDYTIRQRVAISSEREGDRIYYTMDGNVPDENANLYVDPLILMNGETILRAVAINEYGYISEVSEARYQINIPDTEVVFQESLVEYAVRSQLGKSSGPLYNDEVAGITSLCIVGNHVAAPEEQYLIRFTENSYSFWSADSYEGYLSNLSDLEWFPFLTELCIAWQSELDISALSGCVSLERLSLIHNNLTSLEAISGLTNLTELCAAWNQISSLDPVSGLTNLVSLGVWGNEIRDLSPVTELVNLQYLDVSDNRISDLSPIGTLAALEELWLYDNQIMDFTVLEELEQLEVLMMRGNPYTDTETLQMIFPRLTRTDVWTKEGEIQ